MTYGGRVRGAAAAVVLAAALVLTAGCGGGGSDGGGDARKDGGGGKETAAPTAPAPPSGSGGGDGEGGSNGSGPDGTGSEDADRGPKVPAAELTPATGTFTKKQKKYLVDRVPRGTDPAAILEAGQAACDRIATTADADRKAAVSALKAGEIANAEAAVRHLCPKHAPLLKAAGLG